MARFPPEQRALEIHRKLVHIGCGVCCCLILIFLGRFWTSLMLIGICFLGILLSELGIRGYSMGIISWGLTRFDRPEDIRFRPGLGALDLFLGFCIATSFPYFPMIPELDLRSPWLELTPLELISISTILVGTISDSSSTLVGIHWGKHPWRFNPIKTLEGSLGCWIAGTGLGSLLLGWRLGVVLGTVAAIAELIPVLDDNLNIQIGCLGILIILAS